MNIAKVIIEYSVFEIDRVYDYLYDDSINVVKGSRVTLSFGNTHNVMAYVLDTVKTSKTKEELEEEYGFELKFITSVIDEESLLDEELTSLAYFMQKEYFATLISCFQTMLPKTFKPKSVKRAVIKLKPYLVINEMVSVKLTSKQSELYETIKEKKEIAKDEVEYSSAIINALVSKGAITIEQKEVYRKLNIEENDIYNNEYHLNEDQSNAIEEIIKVKGETFLLEGVTGSGKSEVYLHLARHYLNKDQGVILLVPEIILTSQIAARFKHYFGDKLALLHSALSEGEKYDEYRRIKKGEASIVIGTRSAIFAPINNLGLIIIDEEHSTSYKQEKMPCYHTLEIASFRAKYNDINVVLGSATPSIESKTRALTLTYKQLYLPTRINKMDLPICHIIDMNKESNNIISSFLRKEIQDRLEKKQQVILLLNRRGYAPYVKCKLCGYVFKCEECNVSYNYHISTNTLKCHYCGKQSHLHNTCPICNSKYIEKGGYGTQKIEEIIRNEFKDAKVLRMDADSTTSKNAHTKIINKVVNNEVDILIGTQMVAKGLNFPNVTLVGVINADAGLNASDFRANERTFQLIVQVLGRAGRKDKTGQAIIQTYQIENKTLIAASRQDYNGFIEEEIKFRRQLKYPPFRIISYVELSGRDFLYLEEVAKVAKKYLSQFQDDEFSVLGPSVPYLYKIGNNFRLKLMLKYKNKSKTIEIINDLRVYLTRYKNIKITINVDPYSDL